MDTDCGNILDANDYDDKDYILNLNYTECGYNITTPNPNKLTWNNDYDIYTYASNTFTTNEADTDGFG